MNIGLKFRDAMFGKLGQTVREELDQLVVSIVQHWLVGHEVDGSHSNAIGDDAGDPVGSRYLRDDMMWVETDFADVATGETITGAWTFTTLPVLGTLTGYIKGTAGALSAVTTITGADLTDNTVTNAKLSDMAQNTIKLRNTAGSGAPEDVAISSLTTNATPGAGDYFLMESGGNLRKVDWSTLPGAAAGEANTASNQGVGGVGLYDTKVGVDLQFRNVAAGSSKVTVTLDAGNKEVDIDVDEASLTLTSIGGTLSIAKGGTGQVTAQAAIDALVPAQAGQAGKVLQTDGTNVSWQASTGGGSLATILAVNAWGGL